jgi:hypothetical protein
METIKINKLLLPLVNRFLEINDYEKMKTILDIGLSGINLLDKYANLKNENIETNIVFNEEIKKYKLKIEELENINNKIKKEKQEIENNFFNIKNEGYNERELVRNELKNKYNEDIKYYKDQINIINEEKKLLIQSFEDIKRNEINEKTEELRINREKLEKEINYLKQLYVEKTKGITYENELIPKFEEYNDSKLNNKWRILHVGSSLNHKCDFHIKNKDTGEIILIDTKNNEIHKPVSKDDIDKFISDVTSSNNNAVGGILIANNKICKKRDFEINIINNKILLYISHFNFNNIEFIFSMLELICDRSRNIKSGFDDKFIKNNLIENYTFLIERLNNNKLEQKKFEKELSIIREKFSKLFKDDIELYYKGIENLEKKMKDKVENKSNKNNIIDFEEIEKDCKVIGKRTKYYLKYNRNGENIVQYFQNNYRKNIKINNLKKYKNVIITQDNL